MNINERKIRRLVRRLHRIADKADVPQFYPAVNTDKYRWVIVSDFRDDYSFAASQYLEAKDVEPGDNFGLVVQKGKPFASPYIAIPEEKLRVALLAFIMDEHSYEFVDVKTGDAYNRKQVIARHNAFGFLGLLKEIFGNNG